MNRLSSALLLVLFLISVRFANAQDYRKLEGTYAITSASLTDAPQGEQKDRVVMIVKGKAAKEIYDAMPGKAKKSECDAGMLLKVSGGLACTKESTLYSCNVAVLLKTGESTSALVC